MMADTEKHAGGRHSKLTPDLRDSLAAAVRRGNSYENAAALVGIGASTFYRWMQAGAVEPDEEGYDPEFREFWESVTRANAEYLDQAVQALTGHNEKDFRAPLAALERRDRANWGRRDTVDVEHRHSGQVQHNHVLASSVRVEDKHMQTLGTMLDALKLPAAEVVDGEYIES